MSWVEEMELVAPSLFSGWSSLNRHLMKLSFMVFLGNGVLACCLFSSLTSCSSSWTSSSSCWGKCNCKEFTEKKQNNYGMVDKALTGIGHKTCEKVWRNFVFVILNIFTFFTCFSSSALFALDKKISTIIIICCTYAKQTGHKTFISIFVEVGWSTWRLWFECILQWGGGRCA